MGLGTNVYQFTYFAAIVAFALAVLPAAVRNGLGMSQDNLYKLANALFLWSISLGVAAVASKGERNLPAIQLLPFKF